MLTPRDVSLLQRLARYFLMNRRMAQTLCFPTDREGRITRRRLNRLTHEHYITKHTMQVTNPGDDTPAPVYLLADKGRQFLADHLKDERMRVKPIRIAQPGHVFHHLAVASTYITLEKAVAAQSEVSLDRWYNEFEVVNADAADKSQHFTLFTDFGDSPRIVCSSDAAFQLGFQGHKGVFYLEQDRATSGVKQVAAFKSKGYAELQRRQVHRLKHFPETTRDRFSVLLITPSQRRRDSLRREFKDKDGAELWLFAAESEVTAESFLFEPVFWTCGDDAPRPLVKRSVAETAETAA